MKVFDPLRETELHTDASKVGYGACLLQQHDNAWHPVFWLSKRTTPAEEMYSSYDLEDLAVIYELGKLRVYLLGVEFQIVTDCNAFNMTIRKKNIKSRVARWTLQLEEYNCKVAHRSGSAMRHVGALSRNPITPAVLTIAAVEHNLIETIKRAQADDSQCNLVVKLIRSQGCHRDYEVRQGVLYRFIEGAHRLVLPKSSFLSGVPKSG